MLAIHLCFISPAYIVADSTIWFLIIYCNITCGYNVFFFLSSFACDGFSGDEEGTCSFSNSSWKMDCSTVLKVKTIHISSPILAAKSPFFYKVCGPRLCFLYML